MFAFEINGRSFGKFESGLQACRTFKHRVVAEGMSDAMNFAADIERQYDILDGDRIRLDQALIKVAVRSVEVEKAERLFQVYVQKGAQYETP